MYIPYSQKGESEGMSKRKWLPFYLEEVLSALVEDREKQKR